MASDANEPVDRRVREAFAPDPASVERIAGRALVASPSRRRRGLGTVAAATAAVALVICGVAWYQRSWTIVPPGDPRHPGSIELTGSAVGGVLVVLASDHDFIIVGGDERGERPPDGYGVVLVEGESR